MALGKFHSKCTGLYWFVVYRFVSLQCITYPSPFPAYVYCFLRLPWHGFAGGTTLKIWHRMPRATWTSK